MSMEIARTAPAGLATTAADPAELGRLVESLVLRGDISALTPADKAAYYMRTCESLGLNPHSQPLTFLKLNGKEILYASRGATDQLAAMHRINRKMIDGPKVIDLGGTKVVYAVCEATHPNGRTETAIATLQMSDPANIYMKAETKAKRRATLSILGLGMLDESELAGIPASAMEPATQAVLSAPTPPVPAPITIATTCAAAAQAYAAAANGSDPSDDAATRWRAECLEAAAHVVLSRGAVVADTGARAVVCDPALAALVDEVLGLADAGKRDVIPGWWVLGQATITALGGRGPDVLGAIAARAWRGVVDLDAATTRGVMTAWRAEVEAHTAREPSSDDDGDDEPPTAPQSPTRSRRSTATAAGTTVDAAAPEGPAAWLSDDDAAMAHAAGWTHARHVEASVRRHGAGLVGPAAERLVRVATARLEALTADTDGTRMTAEGLRRMAARWAAQGPVVRRAA
jgi:hypothetical protein